MAKKIECPCGWSVSAETDDELVRETQKHAKDVHNQTATREEVLAMAKPS